MNAVIYVRYSSYNQKEESIEGQLRECKEYADRNDIVIVKNYIDRALSAKTDNRPEFQHMIKDSQKGLFDMVLVEVRQVCSKQVRFGVLQIDFTQKRRQGCFGKGKYFGRSRGNYS